MSTLFWMPTKYGQTQVAQPNKARSVLSTNVLIGVRYAFMVLLLISFSACTKEATDVSPGLNAPSTKEEDAQIFTSSDLPGYSIIQPSGWDLIVKPFGTSDPQGFVPKGAEKCAESCMGIRLSKGNIALETIALESLDDRVGERCSDLVVATAVTDSPWTRIQGRSETYYSQSVELNKLINAGPSEAAVDEWEGDGEWSYLVDTQYKVCDASRTSYWLNNSESAEREPIMLEKPRVIGNPGPEELDEMDLIVSSIKGLARE